MSATTCSPLPILAGLLLKELGSAPEKFFFKVPPWSQSVLLEYCFLYLLFSCSSIVVAVEMASFRYPIGCRAICSLISDLNPRNVSCYQVLLILTKICPGTKSMKLFSIVHYRSRTLLAVLILIVQDLFEVHRQKLLAHQFFILSQLRIGFFP